jgi:citrate:succinate antiporter/L-tartrate/succinate antiporter
MMWNSFAVTGVTSSMFLTALAPNAAALAIAKKTVGVDVTWGQWALGFLPVGIILFLLTPLLAYLLYPPEIKESPEISQWAAAELKNMGALARNEWLMLSFVVLAMLLWIFGSNPNISVPLLGSNFINATMVVLLVIALMLLSGVVDLSDIVENKAAWEVLLYFTTLLTLADGLNKIGFVKWFANLASAPLAGQDPTLALVGLVALFFWVHYFFSSITSHTAAIFPIVLAIGKSITGMPMTELVMLCAFSLGLMGVISPYATGPAPMFYGAGYISRGAFWALGLAFGLIFFAALLGVGLPWLRLIGY